MSPYSIIDLFRLRTLARGAAAFALGFTVSQAELEERNTTLAQIRERGELRCGVDTGLAGFALENENGRWVGFEADLCRAYAAAFLGNQNRVEFVPLTTSGRFAALLGGEVDLLVRNTSWTFARDAGQALTFAGIYYYDGQGFLVPSDLGVSSVRELDGARICVQRDTTTALNLGDYAQTYGVTFSLVEVETSEQGIQAYSEGRCDAFTNDISTLAGTRVTLDDPDAHILLPEVISKEPLGPVVRSDDPRFAEAVRWTLVALIAAEEYGITAETADTMLTESTNPEIRRLLGGEGAIGDRLMLDDGFAYRAITANGNYGELFSRHLGRESELGLRRGLNAQWTQGGLLYAPPFR
ncbi:amino acid ABC transporter substrate-binding protein [Marinicauda pacifica]|uniref:amino acid ABC transporter substrate-binding protein n=1 Tax=Marinicauda pacifica TaxID=1133559 RepID=UPI0035C85898